MTIALNMIVRDEADVIARCLASVREHIDYWTIVDTGSVDGTPSIILRELEGIPGALHHSEWVDFGHNRTESLRLALGTADYHLIIDADEILTLADGLDDVQHASSYMASMSSAGEQWWSKRLLRDDHEFRYEPAVHSVPVSDLPDTGVRLPEFSIHHFNDGGCKEGRMEWLASKLRAELESSPDDARSHLYLANTLRDMGLYADALPHYERRAELGGWDEEVWFAQYRTGEMLEKLDRWEESVPALIRALEMRPSRIEPVYALASGYRSRHLRRAAYAWTSYGMDVLKRPGDSLFVAGWMYDWGMLFEHSISAYWASDHAEAVASCNELLRMEDVPDHVRAQVLINREYSDGALAPV